MRAHRDIEEKTSPAFDPAQVRHIRADPRVLEQFYLAFYDEIVRYFARRLSDPQDVADLVADTFIAAVDAAESYNHRRGPALPWLIGIAHNKLRRWYRQRNTDWGVARRIVGRRLLDSDDIDELENRIDAAARAPLDVLHRARKALRRELEAQNGQQEER